MIVSLIDVDEMQCSILVVVIERDNLERMRKADPISLESVSHGGLLTVPKYPNDFSVLIAYEEDDAELYRISRTGNVADLLKHLQRGRRWIEAVDGKKNAFNLTKKGVKL